MSLLPKDITNYIDAHADEFIQRLADAVKIPSVSSDLSSHPAPLWDMANFLQQKLEAVGVSVTLKQPDSNPNLPPVILGSIGNDPKKKTVLLYAHYDVQPAVKSDGDGWNTDPFTLFINKDNGQLVGRGSTDDKGPLLGWLNVLQAHHSLGIELPVNIKLCSEGMEESDSVGLDNLIETEKDGFFKGVSCVCITDNYWLGEKYPCVTYGTRGWCHFDVTVSGPSRDLHSGLFGGTVYEPMTALMLLLSRLVTTTGEILIPGVVDKVVPPVHGEEELYEKIRYTVEELERDAGGATAIFPKDKVKTLMRRMREPSLSIHGIEGAFSGPGAKTIIPAKVSGKFSIRLVPDQDPTEINGIVEQYLNSLFSTLNTGTHLEVRPMDGGKPWLADINHYNYRAATKATEEIYQTPDLTREGGSVSVTLTFSEKLGVNVLLLPMGRGDDGAHSTNEKLDRSNFIEGTKLFGAYLYHVATEPEV